MQHCLSLIAFLLLLLLLLLMPLLLLCDGKHISSMPILFASKNLFIGCGWTCAYITDAWLFDSAYAWIWIQTAQSNDKNNKFPMLFTLFVSIFRSVCVCVSLDVCIECISWCVQVTITLRYSRRTCIDTMDVVCLQNQFNNSHVGTTAHSYDCEIKITLEQTHIHWFQWMRCDAMLCHSMHHCSRPNPFSFLFECMQFKKIPKYIHFMDVNWCRFLPCNPKKLIFRWVIMHYSNSDWNWIL